jgi:putative oxidoreductase
MKITTIIIRTLLGALLLFASVTYFFNIPMEQEKMSESMMTFMGGVIASKYLMPLAKGVELICGLSFITGRYTGLFSLVLLPVSLNILLIHAFMGPKDLPISIFLFAGNLFLIYKNWDHYKTVFVVK